MLPRPWNRWMSPSRPSSSSARRAEVTETWWVRHSSLSDGSQSPGWYLPLRMSFWSARCTARYSGIVPRYGVVPEVSMYLVY